MYSQLYSICSYPNVIFSLLFGVMIDKFGINKILITWLIVLTAGQAIITVIAYTPFKKHLFKYILILVGRLVFGIGKESLGIWLFVWLYNWFYAQEYAFAYGCTIAVMRIGTVTNNYITPALAQNETNLGMHFDWLYFLNDVFDMWLNLYLSWKTC